MTGDKRIARPRTQLFILAGLTVAGLLVRLLVARSAGTSNVLGIAAELADAWLIYAIVRHFVPAAALGAAAFLLFNPAAIASTAALAQLGSVWWGAALAGVSIALHLPAAARLWRHVAWLAGFAVPAVAFVWTAGAYPYNTVNAFNLYATRGHFWQPDSSTFGLPYLTLAIVGALMVAGSLVLIVMRNNERKDDRALLEASLLAALAFFLFATRMHESGIYGALLLCIPLIAYGGRYALAACVLTLTAWLNFAYASAYQLAMARPANGVDPTDLWPHVTHPAAWVNLAVFFGLGYFYLSSARDDDPVRAFFALAWFRARDWFSPREGLVSMTRRDILYAAGFALAAFVLCVLWVQYPAEKIFDEVYYPRAGEEYLKHVDLGGHGPFEFTHPPLTKLIITLSMLLFGGLDGLGDTTLGWRFLNVVVGALMLPLAYAFTKRLTGSTLAAALAATFLLFDGFRFVQARISTPEITVAVLALAVLYAFYRYWTEGETRVHVVRERTSYARALGGVLAAGIAVAALAAWLVPSLGPRSVGAEWIVPARIVVFAYVAVVAYLVAWIVAQRAAPAVATSTSFPDGTIARAGGAAPSFELLDGARLTGGARDAQRSGPGWTRRFLRDGSEEYATPAGTARYAADGAVALDGVAQRPFASLLWMGLFGLACGLLLASKWNGILDPAVAGGLAVFVMLQRFLKRPALYGNPFGMRLDVLAASVVTISGVVYLLCYIPYFALGHNVVDLVEMQHAMYQYHHDLVATHPYMSAWWQWPLLIKPISYYYAALEPYKTTMLPGDCCVAEILALPNPLLWWTGLISVPFVGFLAWKERSRGFLLLVTAYVMQWLPWALSPRIAFEYHFFPNLAIIAICDAILLHRLWLLNVADGSRLWTRTAVITYVIAAIAIFAFFYPLLAGTHIPWDAWRARMWIYPGWV